MRDVSVDVFPSGPRALPDVRLLMLSRWAPGSSYWLSDVARERRLGADAPLIMFDYVALRHAQLWWVTPDMTTLVEHAARTLPPTTLCVELLPGRLPAAGWGLVVFAHGVAGTDSETGAPITTSALLWGIAGVDVEAGMFFTPEDGSDIDDGEIVDGHCVRRALTISTYVHGEHTLPTSPLQHSLWYPTGRGQWRFGDETHEHWTPESSVAMTSMAEDRRLLAALWLLSSQSISETRTERVERAARKRSQRAGIDTSDVRLVDVRHARSTSGSTTGKGSVNWRQRWIVEGHWRQQAYGPGWSLHRPQWIGEFVKGPDDKPLVVRERVNVVRSSPDDPLDT